MKTGGVRSVVVGVGGGGVIGLVLRREEMCVCGLVKHSSASFLAARVLLPPPLSV